jgi:hypothetical protein
MKSTGASNGMTGIKQSKTKNEAKKAETLKEKIKDFTGTLLFAFVGALIIKTFLLEFRKDC